MAACDVTDHGGETQKTIVSEHLNLTCRQARGGSDSYFAKDL